MRFAKNPACRENAMDSMRLDPEEYDVRGAMRRMAPRASRAAIAAELMPLALVAASLAARHHSIQPIRPDLALVRGGARFAFFDGYYFRCPMLMDIMADNLSRYFILIFCSLVTKSVLQS
jgi:hypothetical protein